VQLVKAGKLRPVTPRKVFKAAAITEAFHYMQRGLHMGKILIEMPESAADLPVSKAKKVFSLVQEASYLLVGGLGGIGSAVSTWMVEQGAREIVFFSRSAGTSVEHTAVAEDLGRQGCKVIFIAGDATNLSDVERAVGAATKPIGGVVQMSALLSVRMLQVWLSSVHQEVSANSHNIPRF
jgi:D-arabinose 1-dehydrogenase-like Zn-dependent alcohol dehydrogenase